MKVLLVGEYNRTHWNIKLGLQSLGHEAITFGMQDGFKKVDVDKKLGNPFSSFILNKFRVLVYKLIRVDLLGTYINYKIKANKSELSNFDIVQFISESPFVIATKSQKKAFDSLCKWNKKAFILSTGKDYPSIAYAYQQKLRYSILSPYFENSQLKSHFQYALQYLSDEYKDFHQHVYSKIEGVIACDLDYHIPLMLHPKYLGLIPHAIEMGKFTYDFEKPNNKITILLGVNTTNYYMKGVTNFEKALEVVKNKYAEKLNITIVKNLSYSEYKQHLKKCHILLDQTYSYDQGYNALEAMAMGKVVFSGAEKEWLEHYNIEEDTVVINALPDAYKIAEKLEWLINNPEKLNEISKNARSFVETHHDHVECAKEYLKIWSA